MNKFLKRAQELEASMKSDRHYLHQNAEVGFDLPITTKYVIDRCIINEWGKRFRVRI